VSVWLAAETVLVELPLQPPMMAVVAAPRPNMVAPDRNARRSTGLTAFSEPKPLLVAMKNSPHPLELKSGRMEKVRGAFSLDR
jgi:hypothetical protein